jgi:hypothetical protein
MITIPTIPNSQYYLDPNVEAYIRFLQAQIASYASTIHVIGGKQVVMLPATIRSST